MIGIKRVAIKGLVKVSCVFCGTDNVECFEYDKYGKGFWCEVCDGYNYLNKEHKDRHKFILILEDKLEGNSVKVRPNIKLKKQLSPLRYPGGKSKLIDYVYSKLNLNKTDIFVEPFAGGASVGLALLNAGLIKKLIINDLDYGIYSLFSVIKNKPEELLYKINNSKLAHNDFYKAQEIIKSNHKNCSMLKAAYSLLVVNRLAYSGIYNANPLGGKNGDIKDLLSRWNPKTLSNRIKLIHDMSNKIIVLNMDGLKLIEEMYWHDTATIFVDPPYFKKGKDLYNCYFTEKEHIRLNILLDNLYQGMPGADIIATYDNNKFIESLYLFPETEKIRRVYSI